MTKQDYLKLLVENIPSTTIACNAGDMRKPAPSRLSKRGLDYGTRAKKDCFSYNLC